MARHCGYKTGQDTDSVVKKFTIILEIWLDIHKQVSRLIVIFNMRKRKALNDVH